MTILRECRLHAPFRQGDLAHHEDNAAISEGKLAHLLQRVLAGWFRAATHEEVHEFCEIENVPACASGVQHALGELHLLFCLASFSAIFCIVCDVANIICH